MQPMYFRYLKTVAIMVLIIFSWTFGGLFEVAYAIQNSKGQSAKSTERDQNLGEKFQKSIEEIEQILTDTVTDTEIKKNTLKTKKSEIEFLDIEIRKQFKETQEKINELPEEIKQRHRDFVKKYEGNLNELKRNLKAIEKAKDKVEVEAEINMTKELLKKVKPKKKHIPLDPNKLPYRSSEPIFKEPRLKPEEFRELSTLNRKPVLVASVGSLVGLLSSTLVQATNTPTNSDLSETIEVQFTPEISAKAEELEHNPVKIYEYVKNNYFFEPYYGSLKGAHETLLEGAGNDFDQASLLIALLRVSNVPARYVYGTIEVPIERIKKWLGVEDETVAGEILASNGIPVALVQEGGKISKARLEHVWVEAWVSYENYRGHPYSQNKTWIPLDPGFKLVQYTRGPDLKQIMNFDPESFMNELLLHSTYSTSEYYVSNVSEDFLQQKLEEYQSNLDEYLTNNIPDAKPQDLIGSFDILYEKFGVLPASLPYKVIVKGISFSEVPDTLRHKLQIEIKGTDYFGTGDIYYQTNLSQLAGRRITIQYLPETSADENTLKTYGKLSATPAYLVNMKPVLMIDGSAVATGGAIGLGNIQRMNITFLSPNISTDIINHDMTAGGYYAIGLDLQRIPKALLQKQTDRMHAMKIYIESIISGNPSTPPEGDSRDNLIGDMLYDVAINYFYNLDALNDLTARVTDTVWLRQPSEAIAFIDLKVNTIFGIPLSAKPVGMGIDVDRNIVSPFSMTGDNDLEKAFKMQSGIYSSAMEHIIFEWMFNVNAVSTVRVHQEANSLSIPIYFVSSQNIGQVLPNLQVSSSLKSDIQNAVNGGLTVIIPQTEITLYNWSGTGYIVQNPTTFDGAYRISGGINGGSTTCLTEGNCYFNADHPCILPGGEENLWGQLIDDIDNLLAVANILLLGEVNLQGLADELCSLLQGISPTAPGAFKAEKILIQFKIDVALMVIAISASRISPPEIGDLLSFAVNEILLTGYCFEGDILEYSGYFIIHYLYEYVVLFRAGLIGAFPDLEN